MAIEILEEPQVDVSNGVTYHILAVERTDIEQATEDLQQPQAIHAKTVGAVAISPGLVDDYWGADDEPYMTQDVMNVRGIIDDEYVYDKVVSTRNFLMMPMPFYGLRIGIAKRRAAHRVTSLLRA